jgi:N-acylneuraminate cytidylyltransferase
VPPIAVILARAGSRGVPGKNAAIVGGRPCIAWTIDAALAATSLRRVVVSTDGEDLQRIALEMGADVVARPADLAGDTAPVDAAARHAVRSLEAAPQAKERERSAEQGEPGRGKEMPGPIVVLYANVPVRPPGLIDRAVAMLADTGADSVQSYSPVGKHHPYWTARVDPRTGRVRPWEGDVLNRGVYRRQDLPPAFVPDGGVLVVTRPALFLELPGIAPGPHAFLGREDRRRGIVNEEGSVVDIDAPIDLLVADAVLRRQQTV